MTHEARLTQKRLEGEILKLLRGEKAELFSDPTLCAFCKIYFDGKRWECEGCPVGKGIRNYRGHLPCEGHSTFEIENNMKSCNDLAIPGALAIYMWLEEL